MVIRYILSQRADDDQKLMGNPENHANTSQHSANELTQRPPDICGPYEPRSSWHGPQEEAPCDAAPGKLNLPSDFVNHPFSTISTIIINHH